MPAFDQDEHARINARHYPGTRQLCCTCAQPTGRCSEDELRDDDTGAGPFCEECWGALSACAGRSVVLTPPLTQGDALTWRAT
jgi:hypothetical protein